jgi:D-alanine-D-alanine ligase
MTLRLSNRLRGCETCILVPGRAAGSRDALGYDYDTAAYRREVMAWFGELGLLCAWTPVTPATLDTVLDRLVGRSCLCFNLCDGNEAVDGYPGVSVVRALEQRGLPFTGAGSAFYEATTSKIGMKAAFAVHGVPTAGFHAIREPARDVADAVRRLGFPLIVKPDVSGGSYGISLRSVVADEAAVRAQVRQLLAGLHGFDFSRTGVFLERFVEGREFTGLVVPEADGFRVLAAERVFNPGLPPRQRLLSFERYWETYREEEPLPPGEVHYRYAPVPPPLAARLVDLCSRAFRAVGGDSYARVDLRMDDAGEVFVLEVNANCGLSADPDQSSVGQLCRIHGLPFPELLVPLLEQALARAKSPLRSSRSQRRPENGGTAWRSKSHVQLRIHLLDRRLRRGGRWPCRPR